MKIEMNVIGSYKADCFDERTIEITAYMEFP